LLAGRKTSVSLEDEFWNALKKIANDRYVTMSGLVGDIDAQRQHGNLSSMLRLFVLEYYRGKAAEKLGDEMLVSGICGTSSCFANALRRRVSVVISAPAPVSP
jgi:predicted DNA-binding ribbon-helix-helix protein